MNDISPRYSIIYPSQNGFTRHNDVLSTLCVVEMSDGGRRLQVDKNGHRTILDFSAEQARHLANLLAPEVFA